MRTSLFLKVLFTSLILTTYLLKVTAQDSAIITQRPALINAALLYDFPESYGIAAGVSRPFAALNKRKVSKNGKLTVKHRDYFVSLNGGFYRYPYNHTGLFLFPSIGIRTFNRNSYHEFGVGMGVLRTFYDGKVYSIDALGNVIERPLFGRNYAIADFYYGLALQLKNTKLKNLTVNFKPDVILQFPYNSFVKLHILAEAGIAYNFKNFSTRQKTRNKQKN